jgi:hypothetical protein
MFPVYGGKCFLRKAVNSWSRNCHLGGKCFTDDKVEMEAQMWLRLLCCGFRLAGKAMGQVYQCWGRMCREINVFFQVLISHIFYVLYPFVTYLLTAPRNSPRYNVQNPVVYSCDFLEMLGH